MSPTYPPLPTLTPPQSPEEPAALYAARVLRFLLQHQITATLSDRDLELAQHAARRAMGTRANLGTIDAPELTPESVYERINAAAHLIASTLRARAVDAVAQDARIHAQAPAQAPTGTAGDRLQPKPKENPPGGAYALPSPRQEARRVEIQF